MHEGTRMRRVRRRDIRLMSACAILTMSLQACAVKPEESYREVSTRTALFVSPQGEPFRGVVNGHTPMQRWFEEADTDHDKRISRAEFLADSQAFFAKLDTNQDGFVTSYEETQMQAQLAPEIVRTFGPMEDFVGPDQAAARQAQAESPGLTARQRMLPLERPYGAQAFSWLNEIEPVMSADADLNSKVSLAEFQAMAAKRFDKLDANHDGFFVLSEAPKPLWRSPGNSK